MHFHILGVLKLFYAIFGSSWRTLDYSVLWWASWGQVEAILRLWASISNLTVPLTMFYISSKLSEDSVLPVLMVGQVYENVSSLLSGSSIFDLRGNLGANVRPTWANWGILGCPQVSWSQLRAILEPSWGHLGLSRGHLGASLSHIGDLKWCFRRSETLIYVERVFSFCFCTFTQSLCELGTILGHVGVSWANGGYLGTSLGHLGSSLGQS